MGTLMVLCVILNCLNVAARYVFLSPIIWTEEILGFMLVWGVFVGAVLVTRDGNHLKMDLVSALFGRRVRLVLDWFGALLALGICGLVTIKSAETVQIIARTNEKSLAADIPMAWIYAALPLGFAFIAATAIIWRSRPQDSTGGNV
jgi:TRAP-type C4-dicarboxylate transport system permease small subunit